MMPTGFAITDEFTSLGYEAPVALKVWIKKRSNGSRDNTCATSWPSGTAAIEAALKELEPILASVGLLAARRDDGRLLINRVGDERADDGPLLSRH